MGLVRVEAGVVTKKLSLLVRPPGDFTYKLFKKRLNLLCAEFGISLDHHDALSDHHDALSDVRACAELYLRALGAS